MAKEKAIGVPGIKGMGHAFKKFGMGAIGGLIFLLAFRLFGALGILAAPVIAGAMIKGEDGEDLAFMSGFLLLAMGALATGFGGGGGSETNDMGGVAV